jgi:hypothetical protein
MNAKVDGRVFELDLAPALLELELGADAHEIADARIGEQVEALGLEPGLVALPVHSLQPRVDLGVPTQRRPAAEPSEEWLVVHAAAHERALERVARRGRVALRQSRARAGEKDDRADHQAPRAGAGPATRAERHLPRRATVVQGRGHQVVDRRSMTSTSSVVSSTR